MAISKLHLVSLQTVIPTKPTDPRPSHKVIVPQNISTALRRRFHVVLYYKKASDEDSGWAVAGWIKESLGRALEEQPIIAGRIRPCEDQNDVALEIVANDSGVRMVEARVDMDLADFLDLKAKGTDAAAEAELVFWEDVMEGNPQFSPLVYVQITNFSCGGYAIGISCSLLLADPFDLTNFLNRWANIHKTLFSKTDFAKMPTFYFPSFGNPNSSSSQLLGSIKGSKSDAAQSVILKTRFSDNNNNNILAAACIKEAEREAGRDMASKISLVTKVPSEDYATKVEMCSKEELLDQTTINNPSGKINGLDGVTTWDELGLDNICFYQGYKPVDASCWINSVLGEGSVIVTTSNDLNTEIKNIIVTFS